MTSFKKVSIDFHGVVNSNPEFFSSFLGLMKAKNIEVYITSGGPHKFIARYLNMHNIPYDRIWCIFDYFNAREKVEIAADGSFHIDDKLWNSAKGKFCERENIDLHIDDSIVYGRYFKTPYVRFDTLGQHFSLDKEKVSATDGADVVWQALQNHLQKSAN